MICYLEYSINRPSIALCYYIQAWRTTNIVIRVRQDLWGELEDVSVVENMTTLERYNIKGSIQKKNQSLEQFHAELVKLASEADCGDREDVWARDMSPAHMLNKRSPRSYYPKSENPSLTQ